MSIFSRKKEPDTNARETANNQLSELALSTIHDGVIITGGTGIIHYANPAAATTLGYTTPSNIINLDASLLLKIESKEGRELPENENLLLQSIRTGQALDNYKVCLIVGQAKKRIPVAFSVIPVKNSSNNRIITFRNITKELAEEGEQTEFISTASHEMRTPVASIEGYLSLALNPQTATIDERARTYLDSAHAASQHLGKLFRDLLDVTKLDDGRLRPTFQPVEMVGLIKQIVDQFLPAIKKGNLTYQFGASEPNVGTSRRLDQVIYGFVDVSFMHEIMDNLIDNAVKYTPAGGSIYVNVLGDGDRVLINVTDTGIGISADDLTHIFQKFYRSDNSDTRTIGGTGLGLYLVKQRVEAMGGRVWAESAFGEGSTFYVSLPRITGEEYEKRMIAYNNSMGMNLNPTTKPASSPQLPQVQVMQGAQPAQPQPAQPQPAPQPAPSPQLNLSQTTSNNINGGTNQ
ncbi:PAS domain-containing sensor histidine kinase [Candidatus Saccharibacteria bacterium]|nr:PAS domain-containing sensor histidine kinase [Candidatus Saccharibacteria bacterium]